MPGNEAGDRVHNFFEQGSLSQDQRHTQLEGNWPVPSNNLWGGSERQIGGPLTSGPKNYSTQQSDGDREKGNQFSLGPYGLNFTQSNSRPDLVKNPSDLQQLNLNGFMHTSQAVHARQNEANFLGMGAEPDRHNLTSRGLSIHEAQQRSGSPHSNPANFRSSESPMNFNFLAGQQQMGGQQPGMMQSLPRQQFAVSDAQLLSQLQRQKQFQQLDAMQRNVSSQIPTFPNQMVSQHSPAMNGNPMYETSNYPWASQVMAGNTNWSQRGLSSPMQGYPNGVMMTPEQGQALRLMVSTPQASQSLYGVPVSSSRSVNAFSLNSINKPAVPQVTAPSNPFSNNIQYAPLPDKVSMQDGTTISRPGSEGKSSFEHGSSQGFTNMVSFGSFNEMQQKNALISESGSQDCAGGSELLPEKSVSQSTTKQSAVALDPTEEKILFGSDENIWEAFGNTVGTGGVNQVDGSDLSNGFPILQNGTWSALMQSAVAETSSTDVGMQEEWSGLGYQNTKSQSGNQQSSVSQDNVREQPVWVDRSQRISLDSRNATIDVNNNYVNSSGLQQPFPSQPRRSLPTESQMTQEGRNWLDGNQSMQQHTEKNWPLGNANPSRDFPKSDIGFWSNQQTTFLHNNSEQSSGRPGALNFIESVPANGSMTSADQANLHDKGHNRHTPMDITHGDATRPESISNYNVGIGNPRLSSADNAVPSGLANKINHESDRKFPGNPRVDFWKSVQYGIEGSEKEQHNLNEGPPILDSSVTVPDAEASEAHMTENGDAGENSNDSHRSSFSHRAPAGGLRGNVWTDGGDQRSLPGGKKNPFEHAAERAPLTRKFQYHPMGDLDMDVDSCSYASKEILRPQPMPKHLSSGVRSHEVQGRVFFHGAPKTSDGVSSSGIHPDQFPNTPTGSTSFAKSGELSSQHQNMSSSQNMLELFHKVDQSTEQTSSVSHLSPTDGNRLSEIGSGGQSSTSHGFNLQLAPPSQAIAPSNLNVASQSSSRGVDSLGSGFAAFEKGDKGHAWLASVSSAQYSPSSHPPPQMGSGNDKSGVSGSMGADVSRTNFNGNLSGPLSSGSPYLGNPNALQHHHMVATGEKMTADQSTPPFHMHANVNQQISDSQDRATGRQSVSNSLNNLASGRGMNRFGLRASTHQIPISSLGSIPGMTKNDNLLPAGAKMWSQQQLLGAEAHNAAAELFKSQFQSNDVPQTSSLTQQQPDEQDRLREVDANAVSSLGIVGGKEPMVAEAQPTGKTVGASQGEHIAKHPSDASPSNSAASQSDLEAFHHSLKRNNTTQHSYSLLHQTQAMKGTDLSYHESKRLKGRDDTPDSQEMSGKAEHTLSEGQNNVVRDPSISQSISVGDAKMLNFSPHSGNIMTSFSHGAFASRETHPLGASDPSKFATSNVTTRVEHSDISPQMAPSWLQQYETLKNGQVLSVHNVPRVPMAKNADQQFVSGKPSNNLDGCDSMQLANAMADPGLISNDCETANTYAPSEQVSSLDALVPHVSNPTLASIRHGKRKTATSDLLSWSKEIGQGFRRLQNMSSAEVDWARSSHRLVEKVEDETDVNGDVLRISRPKRRLILTTQLMQQAFRSPSPAVLSLVASSNHEIILYSLARLTVGDACSLVSRSESDSSVHFGSGNLVRGVKISETRRDQHFSKVVEEFVDRAKELENELLRLDKRASILEYRLELQDMERFAVINRFARVHGRGQVDGSESTSSSADPTAMAQRPCPQRYVSAHPMPRNVPERVQCLSL